MTLNVTFWGVRGSRPTPGKQTVSFGGNTPCVQIEHKDQMIILDGGTGIIELGNQMMQRDIPKEVHLFFSHYHWDHIQGIPFFKPLYDKDYTLHFYGETKQGISLQDTLHHQMNKLNFPISLKDVNAKLFFHEINSMQKTKLSNGMIVRAMSVNHPGGCLAYRVETSEASVVYCTDIELEIPISKSLLRFVDQADVLIFDGHFTKEEYDGIQDVANKKGWGHSTAELGIELSKAARVGHLVLFHYKDDRTDNEQLAIEKNARSLFKQTTSAREGMTIQIEGGNTEKMVIDYP